MRNEKTISQFVSKAEAARRLGISIPAVYRQIKLGLIETNDNGRILRVAFEAMACGLSNPEGSQQ